MPRAPESVHHVFKEVMKPEIHIQHVAMYICVHMHARTHAHIQIYACAYDICVLDSAVL